MEMTREEIKSRYLKAEAPRKKKMIQILAELNDCTKKEIEAVLKDEGVMETTKKKDTIPQPEIPLSVYGALREELTRIEKQIAALNEKRAEIAEFIKRKEVA